MQKEAEISLTRTSRLRKIQDIIAPPVADFLYKRKVTADQVTEFGLKTTSLGARIATVRDVNSPLLNEWPSQVSLFLLTIGQTADAFDGPLARIIRKRHPELPDNSEKGALTDALSDRMGELSMAKARIIIASKLKRKLGKILAWGAGVTNTLPSWAKAHAETKGVAVPENGPFPLGIFGSRVPRAINAVISTSYPRIKLPELSQKHQTINRGIRIFNSLPHQEILDAATTVSNLVTTRQRLKMAREEKPTLDLKDIKIAEARQKALGRFAIQAFVDSTTTYLKRNNN